MEEGCVRERERAQEIAGEERALDSHMSRLEEGCVRAV